MIVFAPAHGVVVDGPDDDTWDEGWISAYLIEVRDQFDRRLPADIEVNESFGTWESDFPNEDWGAGPPNGLMTGGAAGTARFWDNYGYRESTSLPSPVNPGSPGYTQKVDHAPQTYRAGSTDIGDGLVIKTHTFQRYRGMGRQE